MFLNKWKILFWMIHGLKTNLDQTRVSSSQSKTVLSCAESIKDHQSEAQKETLCDRGNENKNCTDENSQEKQSNTWIRPPDCNDVLMNCEDDVLLEIDPIVFILWKGANKYCWKKLLKLTQLV